MAKVPTWEVIILIDGPVTLRRPFLGRCSKRVSAPRTRSTAISK
jgi:hypothetical protein